MWRSLGVRGFTWKGKGLSKWVISRVIIGVTPFRVLITLLIICLLSPLPLQVVCMSTVKAGLGDKGGIDPLKAEGAADFEALGCDGLVVWRFYKPLIHAHLANSSTARLTSSFLAGSKEGCPMPGGGGVGVCMNLDHFT